jgi:tape measure domain-containing protein
MADGINFLLELQAKLEGATDMVRALTKIDRAAGKTHEALGKVEHKGEAVTHRMGGWFKELGHEVVKTFTGFLAAEAVWDSMKEGVHLIKDLAGEMINAAASAERTSLAFGNMLGPEEGETVLKNLERFSKASEFTDGPVKAFGQNLLDAGFAGDSLNLAMAAVTDVAARSPNKMEGAANAVQALSRAMLSGTLDARSLRSLKLSPKAVFAQMGKDLGIGAKQVEKNLQAGKIKIEDVVNSLFKAIAAKGGGVLGKTGADMADSFGARWEKFKNIPEQLFEGTANSPGLKALGDSLERLTKMFSPDSALGKSIVTGLAGGLNAFADALKRIDPVKLSDTLIKLFSQLPGLIQTTLTVTEKFVSAVAWVYARTIPGQIVAAKLRGPKVVEDRPTMHDTALNALGPSGEASGKNFIRGIFKDQGSGVADAGSKVGEQFGGAVVAGAKEGLGAHSPSQEFAKLGRMSAEGYAQGLEMSPPSIGARSFLDGVSAPTGGGARGPISVTAPVTIHIAGTDASPGDIAEAVRLEVPAQIIAALEQLGLAGGTV